MTKVSSSRSTTRTQPQSATDAAHRATDTKKSTKSSSAQRPDNSYDGRSTRSSRAEPDRSLSSSNLRSAPSRGLSESGEVKAVNFEKMSQEQKYDYLQKMTVQRAGGDESAWKTGDREVNLIGIRSFNGKPRGAEFNKYDDRIYVARMVDGKKTVEGFPATVDPGRQDGDTAYKLGDGFYRNGWSRGNVVGGELGLRQARDLGVSRVNADGAETLGVDKQLQFHRGGKGDVNQASRGCQVIRGDRYNRFQKILAEAPESQRDFSYNLTDSSTLPGRRADGSFQRTGRQVGHTGERHDCNTKGGIGIVRTPTKRVTW